MFHCGKTTVIPVKTEFIDWQHVADHYKSSLNRLFDGHAGVMSEMELIYGEGNPAAKHYRNRIAALLLEVRAKFEQLPPGTSAGMLDS